MKPTKKFVPRYPRLLAGLKTIEGFSIFAPPRKQIEFINAFRLKVGLKEGVLRPQDKVCEDLVQIFSKNTEYELQKIGWIPKRGLK